MCELYDYSDECSAILLERCTEEDLQFNKNDSRIFDLFSRVLKSNLTEYSVELSGFKDYAAILRAKLDETDFSYNKELIMDYVKRAVTLYDSSFSDKEKRLIHGDLHRYNIMSINGALTAIDPIGYVAPKEFDIVRYIGTELCDYNGDIRALYSDIMAYFKELCPYETLKNALFIDIVFRLHNSLFENDDYTLTDKWLKVLGTINF